MTGDDACVFCGDPSGSPRRVIGPLGGPLYEVCSHCAMRGNLVAGFWRRDCLLEAAALLGEDVLPAKVAASCRCPDHGGPAVTVYAVPWVPGMPSDPAEGMQVFARSAYRWAVWSPSFGWLTRLRSWSRQPGAAMRFPSRDRAEAFAHQHGDGAVAVEIDASLPVVEV